ncbi:hypothetical protein DY037_08195 [Apilactobacillus micheneri]|uniref:hypothetical protein n=1 Tax=Apilactobacillus TaxID=2767877 RepID=UPI001128A7EE|nr:MULTISPECIES: hypothetical protein [Apilactobacillus]TPR12264.1 hypothetical protein DYZ97_07230 [Apilactobacillus timberlakei]TPR47503.1 hypothetical protein DY037_08195 [Apilactobacillus micheneri]
MEDKSSALNSLRLWGNAYKSLTGKNPHNLALDIMQDMNITNFKGLTKDELLDFNSEFRKRVKAETKLQRRKMTVEGLNLIW